MKGLNESCTARLRAARVTRDLQLSAARYEFRAVTRQILMCPPHLIAKSVVVGAAAAVFCSNDWDTDFIHTFFCKSIHVI